MTRIAVLKREEMNAEQGKVFDDVKAAGGPLGGPYWAYIRYPELMRRTQDLSNCLGQGGLPKRARQIAILAIARYWGAAYPWAAQGRAADAIGIEKEIIDTINNGGTPVLSDPREKMAYDVTLSLLRDKKLDDAKFAEAAKLFGEKELVSLIATVGQFSMTCLTTMAYDCTPTPDLTHVLKR